MEQTTIFQAIEERDRAYTRIAATAEYADWQPIAEAFIVTFAHERRGQEFTGEDISDAYEKRGLIAPKDARYWGPVVSAAKKRGVIVALEGRTAPRRKGHGTLGASVYVTGRA